MRRLTHAPNVAIAQMAQRDIHFRDGLIACETRNERTVAPAEISW